MFWILDKSKKLAPNGIALNSITFLGPNMSLKRPPRGALRPHNRVKRDIAPDTAARPQPNSVVSGLKNIPKE